jgi:hypothetical protein
MIFKVRDGSDDARVAELERAIAEAGPGLRKELDRKVAIARAGLKGEKEAAYHIDFHLKDTKNWAVIHDLRLEFNGRVAQIDHLLLNRFADIRYREQEFPEKNSTSEWRVGAAELQSMGRHPVAGGAERSAYRCLKGSDRIAEFGAEPVRPRAQVPQHRRS